MSTTLLLTAILVGAGLLALWIDVRLGDRSPRSLKFVVINSGGALVALQVVRILGPQIIHQGGVGFAMVALFALVLPGWLYAFLASLWALKLLRSAIPR